MKEITEANMHALKVRKNNAFIRASHNLSIAEMRLLLMAVVKIPAITPFDYNDPIEITATEAQELFDITRQASYKMLSRAAKKMIKTQMTIHLDTKLKMLKKPYEDINYLSSCQYWEGLAKVVLRFTPEMAPYISELKGCYTEYLLKHIVRLKSTYSIHLYELAAEWKNYNNNDRPYREFEIDELRELFKMGNKYPSPGVFKDKVLNKAEDEINEHTDLNVKIVSHKEGKFVVAYRLFVNRKGEDTNKMTGLETEEEVQAYFENHDNVLITPIQGNRKAPKRLVQATKGDDEAELLAEDKDAIQMNSGVQTVADGKIVSSGEEQRDAKTLPMFSDENDIYNSKDAAVGDKRGTEKSVTAEKPITIARRNVTNGNKTVKRLTDLVKREEGKLEDLNKDRNAANKDAATQRQRRTVESFDKKIATRKNVIGKLKIDLAAAKDKLTATNAKLKKLEVA